MKDSDKLQKVKRKRGRPRGPSAPPPDALGRECAAQMARRGLSLADAAALIGVDVSSLSRWLREGVKTQYAIDTLKAAGLISQ